MHRALWGLVGNLNLFLSVGDFIVLHFTVAGFDCILGDSVVPNRNLMDL